MSSEFPPLQQRDLILTSGVRVTLLHDPQASRLALGAGIAAGSLHEPPAWPGLAHFLEHALFLGSHGWPDSGAFAAYVQGLGGRYNASTLGLHTRYYLELPADELRPALARFCDLLARPLLDPVRLAAEREVLHAEYLARCRDAGSRAFAALSGLLEAGHPLAGFHAGHRDSLDTDNPALHATLRDWHARHYAGAGLRLLLCAPQPLDELEAAVRAQAAVLPGGGMAACSVSTSPWPSGQPAQRLSVQEEHGCLRLWWLPRQPLADVEGLLDVLDAALHRDDAASLGSRLRAQGLSGTPALDWQPYARGCGLFGLRLEHRAAPDAIAVAALCRDWLRAQAAQAGALCQAGDPRRQAWQEYEQPALERVARWLGRWLEQGAAPLCLWPPRTTAQLRADLAALDGDPLVVQETAACLPDARCSPVFPVRWQSVPLPPLPSLRLDWPPAPAVHLPSVLATRSWPACWPSLHGLPLRPAEAGVLLAWQAGDAAALPGAQAASLLEQAIGLRWAALGSLTGRVGARLQLGCVDARMRLSLTADAAAVAGLLAALLDSLESLAVAAGDAWRRAQAHSAQQILLRQLLAHPAALGRGTPHPVAALDAALAGSAATALAREWSLGRLCAWRLGDLPGSAATPLAALGQPCPLAALPDAATDATQVWRLALPGREQAVLLRVLARRGAARQEAAWRMLAALQQSDFHQRLRVEQGLGYALFCRFRFDAQGGELQYGVQSPQADCLTLQAAIEDFLHGHACSLQKPDGVRLQAARRAALEALEGGDRPARLAQREALALGGWPADWPAQVRRAVLELTPAELLDAARHLAGGATRRWLRSD